jgi:hypothetical protein
MIKMDPVLMRFIIPSKEKIGIMEEWNIGTMGQHKHDKRVFPFVLYPLFQYPSIP